MAVVCNGACPTRSTLQVETPTKKLVCLTSN